MEAEASLSSHELATRCEGHDANRPPSSDVLLDICGRVGVDGDGAVRELYDVLESRVTLIKALPVRLDLPRFDHVCACRPRRIR